MAEPEQTGIPLAIRLVGLVDYESDQLLGEIAISVLEEFYAAFKIVLATDIDDRIYLSSYLEAYDQVTQCEIIALRALGKADKAQFGALICQSGLAYEFAAYNELLKSKDPGSDKKKKEGGKSLIKELEELKKYNEDWIPVPKWLEIVLKSIVDIFD